EDLRVVFLRVIKRPQGIRSNTFDVPQVKEFMGHQRQEATILTIYLLCSVRPRGRSSFTCRCFKPKTRVAQRCRVKVFQPTTCIRSQVKYERVVFVGNLASHYLDFGFYDLLHITTHTFGVVVSFTINHDPVRNTLYVEHESLEIAGFEWRVVKNVE